MPQQTTECLLLNDPPGPGPWNMAVDEALLQWSAASERCVCRFYAWAEPTLSLGYFQNYDQRDQHTASRQCTAVRRLTGGGAILHDKELTYSLVVPRSHPWAARRDQLYRDVHGALVAAWAGQGIDAAVIDATGAGQGRAPFLCFQRRSPGDVVLGPHKIAGSAQRRRSGAVLQHGSVLLRRSPAAPELPGLDDLAGQGRGGASWLDLWKDLLAERLGFLWQDFALPETCRHRAEQLAATRYTTDAWTIHRGRTDTIQARRASE